MIYLASDLHVLKYDKGGYSYFNKAALDKIHEWPELTENHKLKNPSLAEAASQTIECIFKKVLD